MAAVDLLEVTKQVGSTTILNNINVRIKKGEFMVVVGPSGCGKSTLLRLIAGLEELTSGSININNLCVNTLPAAKRDMAMVFQNYALYPHMTVFENMAYALKMRRMPAVEIKKRVEEVAQVLRLTPYLARKPQALSGGQKQRVAMGRAMVRSPSVFLFDEPLSNLDAQLRTEMRHEIKRLHQQFATTSLYVTHDQTEAMTMAERVLVLNHGLVEQIGTPQELYQQPATLFVAGFMGHYPMNFISGTFDKHKELIQTSLGIDFPAPQWTQSIEHDTNLVLAIRPEHLQLCAAKQPNSITLKVEFIDDMGADKLIQGRCIKTNTALCLRSTSYTSCSSETVEVVLPTRQMHLFHKNSGKRIGEWRG